MIDPQLLERTILQVLADQPSNLMLPQPTLHSEVMARLNRAVTNTSFAQRLADLQNQHQIIGIEGSDYTRWKIAANGQARLHELRPL